jgi:hypothetical protein
MRAGPLGSSDWSKLGSTYVCYGHRVRGVVYQVGELWMQRVYVDGEELDRGEWLDRESAIRNGSSAMSRLAFNRRFELNPPVTYGSDDDDDEDDDSDE